MNTGTIHTPPIPETEIYLSMARLCDKLSRAKSWVYEAVKTDPTFPKARRIGSWPIWANSEIDTWIEEQTKNAVPLQGGKRLVKQLLQRRAEAAAAAGLTVAI